MTGAAALLAEFHRRGIEVRPRGDMVAFRPQAALTPELHARLVAHKPELLALLREHPELGSPPRRTPALGGLGLYLRDAGACPSCGGVIFWKLRTANELVCVVCHPPVPPPDRIKWRRGRSHG